MPRKQRVYDCANIAIQVPVDVLSAFEKIADATARTRDEMIVRSLRTYLLNEGGDILSAIRGREQIAAGAYEDMDDVLADVDRIIAGMPLGAFHVRAEDASVDALGLDELDRGESADLDDVLEQARHIVEAAERKKARK